MTGLGHHVFTGTLDKYTGDPCISCAYVAPGPPVATTAPHAPAERMR